MLEENTLFYGDNLEILRDYIPDESVDLIYLDPPFNSNRSYNVIFKEASGEESEAQIEAFEDSWRWTRTTENLLAELVELAPDQVVMTISGFVDFLGRNDLTAYLVMMAPRLVELRRVLKPTGSLYLHCDPTTSHYLKVLLDAIFMPVNFKNEVIWKRTSAHSSAKRCGPIHDVILYYSKSSKYIWNSQYLPYSEKYLKNKYRHVDADGRRFRLDNLTAAGIRRGSSGQPWRGIDPTARGSHWQFTIERLEELDREGRIYWPPKGKVPQYKRYLDEVPGVPLQDIWIDISPINSQAKERLGYPTQKPLALLERIIKMASNKGDWVLDPFCGCGTAIDAAQGLGRRWIGIDITHLAVSLMKYRLKDRYELEAGEDYDVIGEPTDLAGAQALAKQNRFQFEWWALSLIRARPYGGEKRGADTGIDGVIYFIDEGKGKPKKTVVQVKSGKVGVRDIRDLAHVVEREKAALGVFVTLEEPTGPMLTEALGRGFYHSPGWGKNYPRLQVVTVDALLRGEQIEHPPFNISFKEAQRAKGVEGHTLPMAM